MYWTLAYGCIAVLVWATFDHATTKSPNLSKDIRPSIKALDYVMAAIWPVSCSLLLVVTLYSFWKDRTCSCNRCVARRQKEMEHVDK